MKYLTLASSAKIDPKSILCVALCHNETNILQDFLDHYRSLGNITFLIVDDRSSDNSREILLSQNDVTLFQPVPSSTYKEHKRYWRQELLDQFGTGRWCLIPDIDEHFVYLGMENKPISSLILEIQSQGFEAMHAIMIDMYADKPLAEQIYNGGGLRSAFPYFDGADNYWLMATPNSFRSKFPTPQIMVYGGMRERLIFSNNYHGLLFRNIFSKISGLPYKNLLHVNSLSKYELIRRADRILNRNSKSPPVVLTKIPLVFWKRGLYFNGGAHALNAHIPVFPISAGLLHYRFTRGIDGLQYSAARGQHADNGAYCKIMLDEVSISNKSPLHEKSKQYINSLSLNCLLSKQD